MSEKERVFENGLRRDGITSYIFWKKKKIFISSLSDYDIDEVACKS